MAARGALHRVIHTPLEHLLLHDAHPMRKPEVMQELLALNGITRTTDGTIYDDQPLWPTSPTLRIAIACIAHHGPPQRTKGRPAPKPLDLEHRPTHHRISSVLKSDITPTHRISVSRRRITTETSSYAHHPKGTTALTPSQFSRASLHLSIRNGCGLWISTYWPNSLRQSM